MAYVAQQAWIQNATVRDNVVFSRAYREDKYRTVLSACQLDRDLEILSAGDMTEIGEKVRMVMVITTLRSSHLDRSRVSGGGSEREGVPITFLRRDLCM